MTYSLNTLNNPRADAAGARPAAGRFAHEIALVLGFAALLFWLLALLSHSAQDAAWSTSGSGGAVRNWGGRLGAWLADLSYFSLGFSVWWCFAAAVRAWMATLARWMRGAQPVPAPAGPPRFSRTRPEIRHSAGSAGQQADDALGDWGFSPAEVAALRACGALA